MLVRWVSVDNEKLQTTMGFRDKKKRRNDRGAHLVEFVIIFPFFIVVVFIFMYLGVTVNARSSLTAGMVMARNAWTRANNSVDALPSVTAWYVDTDDSEDFPSILHHNISADDAETYYDDMINDQFGVSDGLRGAGIPLAYSYGQSYVTQYMKQSIGNSIKYPCKVDGAGPNDGPGCLECENLPPVDTDVDPLYHQGMRCRWRPDNILLGPIDRLIGLITGEPNGSTLMVVTREVSYEFDPMPAGY